MTDLERQFTRALRDLEKSYSEREQRLEEQLNGLGAQLETSFQERRDLNKQVQALAQQVEDLASQLTEFQKVLPKD